MSLSLTFALVAVAGTILGAASWLLLRSVDARPTTARRLAGPPELKVGRLLSGDSPGRPVRVAGRIRCRDPLDAGYGERLVAFHRDVEVRAGGAWRSLERMRETRSFELWDHDGSMTIDPARAAEPLITIPKVWRGRPDELEEPHASAAARLAERHGPLHEARAVTRSINVTDRLLVLAVPGRGADGRAVLDPPDGGYLVTNLELDDAMRLLGGRHRRAAAAGVIGIGVAAVLVAGGVIGAIGAVLGAILT
ncbi:MAG TPA: hypothetical protein VMP86_00860 [Candidatus Binatia bacterium]|nr:hypothetical protein [Candidatus Binatia bacterium]